MSQNSFFPYPLIVPYAQPRDSKKSLFIDDVEKILEQDLQHRDAFGCKIDDCHIAVGSKIHTDSFIEAELLFHNGQYNRGFALLTANKIIEEMKGKCKNVLIIGYEPFSELFVCETIEILKTQFTDVEYGIYDGRNEKESKIYYRDREKVEELIDASAKLPLCLAFVVPVNTTLTTHDKIQEQFFEKHTSLCKDKIQKSILNIGLIVIGDKNNCNKNDFWEVESDGILKLTEEKKKALKRLGSSPVYYFAKVNVQWERAGECLQCFPKEDSKLTEEVAVFSVDHASIVPLLQLYADEPLPAHNEEKEKRHNENLERVYLLHNHLECRHIALDDNHYQHYFHTAKYFAKEQGGIEQWLGEVVKKDFSSKTDANCKTVRKSRLQHYFPNDTLSEIQVLDILVAPRNSNNARFLQQVNTVVFDTKAHIIYFDAKSDFRSNVIAKYTSLRTLVNNIRESKQKTVIMFHYVDDSINSGLTFRRCKSMLQSIVQCEKLSKTCHIDLFTSTILLLSRISSQTKASYVETSERFFNYVHLSISPLRTYSDSCPLCKIVDEFCTLKKRYATTTQIVEKCDHFAEIHNHTDRPSEDYEKTSLHSLQMLYSHLLKELLSGNLYAKEWKKPCGGNLPIAIDENSREDILQCIQFLYSGEELDTQENLDYQFTTERYRDFLDLSSFPVDDDNDKKVALIKVISRPFFFYQLRFRQAAFQFCIEELDKILFENVEISCRNSPLIRAFVNALADMNANYILREKILFKLLEYARADPSGEHFGTKDILYAIKKVTTLSRDHQKTLLLEHILIHGHERIFLNMDTLDKDNLCEEVPDLFTRGKVSPRLDETLLSLYLENTFVLTDGMGDLLHKEKIEDLSNPPYYLDDFETQCKLNDMMSISQLANNIKVLKNLATDATPPSKDKAVAQTSNAQADTQFSNLCYWIKEFFDKVPEGRCKKATVFLVSLEKEATRLNRQDKWDKYYTFPELKHLANCVEGIDFVLRDKKRDDIYRSDGSALFYRNEEDCAHVIFKICGNVKHKVSKNREFLMVYLQYHKPIENVSDFFFVRLLLTMRNKIAEVIDATSIQALIKQSKNERIGLALAIDKAITNHASLNLEGRFIELAPKFHLGEKKGLKDELLLNKLLQIANEKIAEHYRAFAKSAMGMPTLPQEDNADDRTLMILCKEDLPLYGFAEEGSNFVFRVSFYLENKTTHIPVTISFDSNSLDGRTLMFPSPATEVSPLTWLTFLLAGNVLKHSREKENDPHNVPASCHIEIFAEGNSFVIQSIYRTKEGTPYLSFSEQDKAKIQELLRVPPIFREESQQSITLWTLNKLVQSYRPKSSLTVDAQTKTGFTVKLDVLKEVAP